MTTTAYPDVRAIPGPGWASVAATDPSEVTGQASRDREGATDVLTLHGGA